MNLLGQRMFNARPHPDPLPRGEGTGCQRFATFGSASGKFSRKFLRETANDSPAPRGEGRGEGGRHH